jgi:Zn-dependent protease with chaperone function
MKIYLAIRAYLITLIITALIIFPFFHFFSKNYFLLSKIILATWVSFTLITLRNEKKCIKDYNESFEIKEDFKHGWLLDYAKESCQELGIQKIPKLRLDMDNRGTVEITGNHFSSTIMISENYYYKYDTSTLKALVAHELGHLYFDHITIRGFVYYLKLAGVTFTEIFSLLCDSLGNLIALIPIIGGWIAAVIILLGIIVKLIVAAFVFGVNFVHVFISRLQEYEADKFTHRLNMHQEFVLFLDSIESEDKRNFFNLEMHPMPLNRKRKLLKFINRTDVKILEKKQRASCLNII